MGLGYLELEATNKKMGIGFEMELGSLGLGTTKKNIGKELRFALKIGLEMAF